MTTINGDIDSSNLPIIKSELHADPIDINTSISPLASAPISLDTILQKCGDLGRFQLFHYFFINLISVSAAVVGFYYVFAAADIDHRCRLAENVWPNDNQYHPINKKHEILINLYIPKTADGKKWEECVRYLNGTINDTLVTCPNGWAYDRSIFGYTFTEEANLVCGSQPKKSWIATLMQCGGFALLFIGSFADKFGRKKTIATVSIILFIICLITQIMIQWIPMSINVKFILLLLNQFASGLTAAAFSLIFILVLELTSSAHTGFAGNFALVLFTIGEGVVTLFAYLAKDWQLLKWINTAFIGLVIPYLYFMPESPLYLYSKRDFFRLEALLRRIATTNKRDEADWYPVYQELLRNQSFILSNQKELTFLQKAHQILAHRSTVIKLLITALLGFTTLMLYIKISYGLAAMSISPYLGILIGAAVEAGGYVTGSLLISTRLARKGSFILVTSVTIICVILIPIISNHSPIATVFIAQFGKFAISGSIAVSWIFVPELFPTAIRSGANGFFIAFSRIGAIVAPIIDTSISDEYLPYTFYASAGLALIVVLLTLLLPETKYTSMDDEEDYEKNRSDA
ncbi:unnamed protein product [Rotaria socialis]|uniref:Major facilitator superfamily (MFS) profile domain-containing protein n=1 Tax=Rotaria socialis TaxID=392032 RepID=A0A817RKG7_9BILA|nr:unnamed protein product [Rotaria socialis]CAF3339595.1 unnamed protein product [Rotaria socialis]CAF4309879.1 unnamed protein product [Rotaria socialis]CAF4467137.1 unnamed protein product [Rotaria socialis]